MTTWLRSFGIVTALCLVGALTLSPAKVWPASPYKIGVYYFPGWKTAPDTPWNPPWEWIQPYPERYPRLGFYPEGGVRVAEQHIQWMHDYGLSCVIYDWYWTAIDGKPVGFVLLPECLEQYCRSFGKDSGQLLQIARDMVTCPQRLYQVLS